MSRTTERSEELYARASARMPGGVSSPVRAFRSVGGTPVFYDRAAGSRFRDVDGNEYVDYCMSWGPLILGHAHPEVVEAVVRATRDGLSFGACCAREVELADRVLDAFPAMDQVRFVSSGTEAVMTAIRLARGVTGRPKILKFDGGYHGHSDSLLVSAGSGLVTFGTSSSLGVPESFAAETIVCPFDDEEAIDAAFSAHGADLAAVIVEPMPANNGLLEQRPEWLRHLRERCSRSGSLLVFDEVISGFRVGWRGYGDRVGVGADLVTLGKIIGGGMPVGAVAGPKQTMEALAPVGGVYQAGTLSGNPAGLAAGIATLDVLARDGSYETLEALGRHFDEVLRRELPAGAPVGWRRVGSVVWLHLAEGEPPRRADRIRPEAADRYRPVHAALLDAGIYLAPSAYEVAFFSLAHTPEEVEELARAIADQVARLPVDGSPA